jgi:uncharacterized protein (DUF1697 family)
MPARAADRWIALFRGINVGTAKRIAMADLRALFEGLGFTNVRTLLNSGNVVFDAPKVTSSDAAQRIENALQRRHGFTARVTILSAVDLDRAARENPLDVERCDPSRLLLAVWTGGDDLARLKALAKERYDPEGFALGSRAAYLWCPDGILASRIFKAINDALGDRITTRNWATVAKLQALAAS